MSVAAPLPEALMVGLDAAGGQVSIWIELSRTVDVTDEQRAGQFDKVREELGTISTLLAQLLDATQRGRR
jgi:hypothetical protein